MSSITTSPPRPDPAIPPAAGAHRPHAARRSLAAGLVGLAALAAAGIAGIALGGSSDDPAPRARVVTTRAPADVVIGGCLNDSECYGDPSQLAAVD
jgi:hypothetical protein